MNAKTAAFLSLFREGMFVAVYVSDRHGTGVTLHPRSGGGETSVARA